MCVVRVLGGENEMAKLVEVVAVVCLVREADVAARIVQEDDRLRGKREPEAADHDREMRLKSCEDFLDSCCDGIARQPAIAKVRARCFLPKRRLGHDRQLPRTPAVVVATKASPK